MEHSLQAQLSRLIYDLQAWEATIYNATYPVPAERLARWKIGLEADLEEALANIKKHLSNVTSS